MQNIINDSDIIKIINNIRAANHLINEKDINDPGVKKLRSEMYDTINAWGKEYHEYMLARSVL